MILVHSAVLDLEVEAEKRDARIETEMVEARLDQNEENKATILIDSLSPISGD